MIGKHTINYKLQAIRLKNYYSLSLYFEKADETWELHDFFIRKTLRSVVRLMEKEYGIHISENLLRENVIVYDSFDDEREIALKLWDKIDKSNIPSLKVRVAQILGWSQQTISYLLMGKKTHKSDYALFIQAVKQANFEHKKGMVYRTKLIQEYNGQ